LYLIYFAAVTTEAEKEEEAAEITVWVKELREWERWIRKRTIRR